VKWHISKTWRNDIHYVWCSSYFDPAAHGPFHVGSLIPATSSPAAIYKDLARATASTGSFDKHNGNIIRQRSGLLDRIEKWRAAGEIADSDADEAIAYVSSDDRSIWRPLLYIIPCAGLDAARVTRVHPKQRAGLGPEYTIPDLAGTEFEWISLDG
jgi:hypothetical protein